MRADVTITIIGGGIGGLSTAIALRQRGFEVEVYEAAVEIAAIGAGIMLPPNAMQIMTRLGLASALRAEGHELRRAELHDAQAGLLQRIDLTGGRVPMATTAIHRGRLQRVLVSQLPPASLHVGKRCAYVESLGDHAIAHFADGSSVRADVMIGADGLRSVAREAVNPGVPLRYAAQSAYRGIAHMRLEGELRYTGQEVWGAGCRAGFGAVAGDEVYWFVALDAPANARDAPGAVRAHVASLVAGFPAPIPALIAASDEAQTIRTDLYDFAPMRPWHRGRVVLIGDAAHATTPNLGQGGAQAIEDAWVLADRLSGGGPIEAALASYEAARVAKATLVVERSRQFGRIVHLRNPVARALRNFALRHTPAFVTNRQMESLFLVD